MNIKYDCDNNYNIFDNIVDVIEETASGGSFDIDCGTVGKTMKMLMMLMIERVLSLSLIHDDGHDPTFAISSSQIFVSSWKSYNLVLELSPKFLPHFLLFFEQLFVPEFSLSSQTSEQEHSTLPSQHPDHVQSYLFLC